MKTNMPGVFAAGDITNTPLRQVTSCLRGRRHLPQPARWVRLLPLSTPRNNRDYRNKRWEKHPFMARLFRPDGVRGIANREPPASWPIRIRRGRAYVLTSKYTPRASRRHGYKKNPVPAPGAARSPRASAPSAGAMLSHRRLPTPALAASMRLYEADAAVIVSASHNPMEYLTASKWFDKNGFKLSSDIEDRIESIITSGEALPKPEGREVGRIISAVRAKRTIATISSGSPNIV
ncbi:MAG: hypothetical protein R2881_09815 [Eubacteriales bacterium]